MNCNKIKHDKNCNTIIQEDNYDSNYAFVYVLQLNQTTGITSQVFIKTSEEEQVVFDLGLDGFYTLVTLKVPMTPGSGYYYYGGKFYNTGIEVGLQDIIEVNPEVSGIEMIYDYYFQTCRLEKCFINACYQIFDSKTFTICNNPKVDPNITYKRDLIWSALNAIKYMVEVDQYEEAERLLERVVGCNGLCDNHLCNDPHNNLGCGCG